MSNPTPEQIEAAAKAMSEASSGFFPEGSWSHLAREALVAAAGAAPQEQSAGKSIAYWAIDASDPAVRADCVAARDVFAAVRAEVNELAAGGYPVGILLRLLAGVSPAPAQVDEARLTEAMQEVESVHQIHGTQCVCGFKADRARSRTEHITGAVAEHLRGGGR